MLAPSEIPMTITPTQVYESENTSRFLPASRHTVSCGCLICQLHKVVYSCQPIGGGRIVRSSHTDESNGSFGTERLVFSDSKH